MDNGHNNKAAGQDCVITGLAYDGEQIRGGCHRLDRHRIVFEVYTPQVVIHSSEALSDFKIIINGRTAYGGRAVIKNLIGGGTRTVCEATLDDGWIDASTSPLHGTTSGLRDGFAKFLLTSSGGLKILPEFKIVVGDLQAFLLDLRHWVGQVELGWQGGGLLDSKNVERDALQGIDLLVRPLIMNLFDRFEEACKRVDPDLNPAHAHYVKRLLHPITLCAPFMYRSFEKPLGYAGDYEMVNMMMADPYRGDSAFAKVLNSYFLSTPPVVAHQHRVTYLMQMLREEVCRKSGDGSPVKIFNLGCGPALEIQGFLEHSELSNRAQFTLLDFNDETIDHVSRVLRDMATRHGRTTAIQCLKKSVIQLLKEAARPESTLLGTGYDVIYCAGLFDYLTAPVCEKLMSLFYEMLSPGGLLVATNVYAVNPSRNWMEYSVDWHLIYRDRAGMVAICPRRAPADACLVKSDPTGLNLFVEVRKPAHV
jgi:extracellular factor (EF) 3-hydroxypalmitic acid methyl ester biosynthesis protein